MTDQNDQRTFSAQDVKQARKGRLRYILMGSLALVILAALVVFAF